MGTSGSGAFELLGCDQRKKGQKYTPLNNSYSLSALRLTEVLECAITLGSCDTEASSTSTSSSSSLGRSLGGLFGLGGSTTDLPPLGLINTLDAVRVSQMRGAICPIKIQWAMALADLGLLKGASTYAKEAKNVLINMKQGKIG